MAVPERAFVVVLMAIALCFGVVMLDQDLNRLNEPAIALSKTIIAGSASMLEWATRPRPDGCRR